MKKSQPVLIAASVLAAAQVFLSFAGVADILSKQQMTIGSALVAAATVGVAFYVRGQVVPLEDVTSYLDKKGEQVSGPAAPPEGQPVDVVLTDEPAAEANDPLVDG